MNRRRFFRLAATAPIALPAMAIHKPLLDLPEPIRHSTQYIDCVWDPRLTITACQIVAIDRHLPPTVGLSHLPMGRSA